MSRRGVVAAGHPESAAAGAAVLRAGGNAVDAAVAAVLTSFVAEPLLSGLGSGGYLLVVPPGGEAVLLDFFVETPGREGDPADRAPLRAVTVDFGDATQVFHAGAASCGTYGTPAGLAAAVAGFGRAPLHELVAPAVRLARAGVRVAPMQAYLYALLAEINAATPHGRARYLPGGRPPRTGDVVADPELAEALERFGAEGAAPFYTGDVAAAVVDEVRAQGGLLGAADLAAYEVLRRDPLHVEYRDVVVCTNPPPSAGGVLLGRALTVLNHTSGQHHAPGPPDVAALLAAMAAAERERTPEFLAGLTGAGLDERGCASANRLGSTTHVSVLDADGWACSVTTSNGEGSGVVVPGTGVHLNNVLGEEDLSPLGFHAQPPGCRLPSMMAPTVVLQDDAPRLVVGSAGSNRIRSTLLQVIVSVVDRGLVAQDAVDAPRLHYTPDGVYAEPGIPAAALAAAGLPVTLFRETNLYFGGCQAVARDPVSGALSGGADHRRGGAVAVA